jgi:2-polyprenyl-3-methyl-5-hydroxy-6-metoxy-1,4-benzoquinol methylase
MSLGYHVTVVDPDPCVFMLAGQARNTGGAGGDAICQDFMDWNDPGVFDAVVSLSTIEHIEDDVAFIKKLQKHAKHGIFLTTDFSMDGGQYSPAHLRTYTPKTLKNKIVAALDPEWNFLGTPDWKDNGPWVDGYNFACVGCVNEEV